jgi:hypothetical protein
MAWQIPVIDRGEGATCLPDDLNRIDGNINYLLGTSLKTDFNNNDILTIQQWQDIVNNTISACGKYGIKYVQEPTLDMTSYNFNNVENLLLQCYETLIKWRAQAVTNVYVQNQYDRYVNLPNNNYTRGYNY